MAVALPYVMIATSVMSVAQSQQAAGIQRSEAELSAKSMKLAGTQREADRKERLAMALASQNAASGASGISGFEGSPLTIMEADIKRGETAGERDRFNTTLGALTTEARGRAAASGTRTQGLLTGIQGFTSAAQYTQAPKTQAPKT